MNNDKTKGRFRSGRNLSLAIDSRSQAPWTEEGQEGGGATATEEPGEGRGMNNGRSAPGVFPALAELLALCGI